MPWDQLYRWAEHDSVGRRPGDAGLAADRAARRPRRRPRRDHGHRRGRGLPHRRRHARRAISPPSSISTYAWARASDFSQPAANARFWYVSEEKLEPRLGERADEPGAELEQPLAVARDVESSARCAGASPARRDACRLPAAGARASPHRAPRADRRTPPLRRGARQPDRRRHARHRSACAASSPSSASPASTRSRTSGCASPSSRARPSPTSCTMATGTAGSGVPRTLSHDRIAQRDREPRSQGRARRRHELGAGGGGCRRRVLARGAFPALGRDFG